MWLVEFENPSVEKEIIKLIQSKQLTENERNLIGAWIRQIKFHGPESVEGDRKWSDHPLEREWEGYRSSCFSKIEGGLFIKL